MNNFALLLRLSLFLIWVSFACADDSIESINFPQTASPGDIVEVRIKTPLRNLETTLQCGSVTHSPYQEVQYIKRELAQANDHALSRVAGKALTFSLPTMQQGYFVWVRLKTENLIMEAEKRTGGKFEKKFWIRNGKAKWSWFLLRRYIFANEFKSITVNAGEGEGIDCVVISPDASFNPNISGPSDNFTLKNSNFSLQLPSLLDGVQPFKISVLSSGKRQQRTIKIHLDQAGMTSKDIFASGRISSLLKSKEIFIPGKISWLSLGKAANVGIKPEQSVAPILNNETLALGKLEKAGLEFPIPKTEKAFAGVWFPASESELKKRQVTVAQAGDKVRQKTDLPKEVIIPIKGKHKYLAFLHSEIGAGEQGDHLWDYVVIYRDWSKEIIKIIEGEQISGFLKGENPAKAVLFWSGLIDLSPSKVFLYTWKNPHPEKEIVTITFRAQRKKIIPVLLGLGSVNDGGATEEVDTESANLVEINLLKHVRPVRSGLFSINNPCLTVPSSLMGKNPAGMDLILNDDSWKLYHKINFPTDRIWIGKYIAGEPDGKNDYGLGFQYADLAVKRIAENSKTRILLNIRPPKWSIAEGNDQSARAEKAARLIVEMVGKCLDNGWPIEYVELFNETLIRHPKDEVKRIYICFNAVAAALKKNYPELKIAGTAECWPAVHVLRDFVKNCGDNLDAVSWHLYATGHTKTPTEVIMKKTPQMAISSRDIAKMLKKVRPDRKIGQLITEYNINYAAWKNGVESRHRNGIGALWLLSVMRHLLYDGEVEVANYWHYAFNSCYGIGFQPGTRLNPAGTVLWLANNYLRGNLCQAVSNSADIEVIASDNGQDYILVLLNKSKKQQKTKINIFNMPDLQGANDFFPIEHYSVSGVSEKFTRRSLTRDYFYMGQQQLSLEPFSVNIYKFSKNDEQ